MKFLIKAVSAIAIIFLGLGAVSETTAQNNSAEEPTITITEYSDYQCPACAYFHPIVKKLKDNFGDQIQVNLKFFPLNNHQYAALAARAAQSAKNQGKFHEMHNLLYENQKHWSSSVNPTPIFEGYAEKLDLDMEEFQNDLNAAETQKAVMQEKAEGREAGVSSTPSFFIDGQQLENLPRTYSQFEEIIQQHLDQKENG